MSFKKLRFYLRLIKAFFIKFKLLFLIGAVLGVISSVLLYYLITSGVIAKSDIIGVAGRYHTDDLPTFILEDIGDGLTNINESGEVVPALAESWETVDGGKTWVFTLKENVSWQDGSPVTSETINYEFSDTVIERPDDKTIVFKLDEVFTPFPTVVSKPTFIKGLLGTGEWVVEDILISNSIVQQIKLVKNDGEGKLIKFYPTEESVKLAFKLGEIDKVDNLYDPTPLDMWNMYNFERSVNSGSIVTLFYNTEAELVADKAVRQALAYAIKKDNFTGERALSAINPNHWAYNPLVKAYDYDPERADTLIEDLPEEVKSQPISLITTPILLNEAELIARDWRDLGFDVNVQVSSVVPSDFQVFLTIFDPPVDPDQYSFWHSTQTDTNISRYKNPRIDKLLEDGRREIDIEARRTIYLDFQRFLLEDLPAAFLYHPYNYKITR